MPNGYGGTTDLVARSIAQKMSEALGEQIVVDNRPGSGGIVGTEMVARSPADGYTLLMGTIGNLAISPHLYKKLAYDPLRDFAAVTQLAASAYVLVVHPAVPAQSVREFVALAKAKPGAMNYASAGKRHGIASHDGAVQERHRHGGGPHPLSGRHGGTDGSAGRSRASVLQRHPSRPHLRTQKLRPLAVTTARRSAALPDVPTVAEAGHAAAEATSWTALVVPAGTPRATISRLHKEAVKALSLPDVRERLKFDGAEPVGSTPDEFTFYLKQELVKWRDVVETLGCPRRLNKTGSTG